jgi:ferredoxin--NADP+ reductase
MIRVSMEKEKKCRECPFLEKAVVMYCKAFPVKKLVPDTDSQSSSPCAGDYESCRAYKEIIKRSEKGEAKTSPESGVWKRAKDKKGFKHRRLIMNKIERKIELAPDIKLFEVSSPLIAKKALPGQFVTLRVTEEGERIPLTIVEAKRSEGTLVLIFQEIGKTTRHLGTLEEEDTILDIVGPLGQPSCIEKFGTVVCIGGGIGVAPLYPIAKALKNAGNQVISILGARSKNLLILEKEMREVSDELFITTDDGSYGCKGFVSGELERLIKEKVVVDRVVAIGPLVMMRAISDVTRPLDIPTIVSLNPIMVDGTGMCGACRVEIDGKTRFACVHGPEFEGHKVNYDLLAARQRSYLYKERTSLKLFEEIEPSISKGLFFHRGHTYIRLQKPISVRIGLDDFGQRLTGNITGIKLPSVGGIVRKGKPGWSIVCEGKEAELLSPIDGVITDVNRDLISNMASLNKDPYGKGWVFRATLLYPEEYLEELIGKDEVHDWLLSEKEKLHHWSEENVGVVMSDGGYPAQNPGATLNDQEWKELVKKFFLT